jgi:hypothetical protein
VLPDLLHPDDRVMSAGSCFAANIVPYLEKSGFEYVCTEARPRTFAKAPPENLGYDNFSAAYGNIYTARQLRQLLDRIQGWMPAEQVWQVEEEFVDPFRPGLLYRARSLDEFHVLTNHHLERVRLAFETATVFVFTLGLTEAWVSKLDGAVYPACPGTVSGEFDPERHSFYNMTVVDVVQDLTCFIEDVRRMNPTLRIILTVSPVPLVATATGGHVLPATIYSKSVLRVAADEVARSVSNVIYFPAYEIVTGPQAPPEFYEADRRNVSRAAVDAVMAAFLARCEGGEVRAVGCGADQAGAFGEFAVMAECEEMMSDAADRQIRSATQPIPRGKTTLRFNDASDAIYYLRRGFSGPERGHVWTNSELATIVLPLAEPVEEQLSCSFYYIKPKAPGAPPVRLTVMLIIGDGTVIRTANDVGDGVPIAFDVVDARLSGVRDLMFHIAIMDPFCPWVHGLSEDKRQLGMGLQAISIEY